MSRGRALGPGRLVKRGRNWFVHWTDEFGQRQRKALSTERRTAERIRAEIIHRRDLAIAGLGAEAGQDLTIDEVANEYLAELKTRVSEGHFRNVSGRLRKTVAQLDGMRIRDLRSMHVVRLRSEATAAGASHRTANLVVQSLQAAMSWAVDCDLIAHSPVGHVKPLPYTREHQRYRRRALSEAEATHFLNASKEDDEQCEILWDYPRVPQTVFWLSLLEIGARYGEMRQVTWGDVDLKRCIVRLRAETTKSRKERCVPLRADLVDSLRRLKMFHETVHGRLPKAADFVFLSAEGRPLPKPTTNPGRIFARVLKAAGIPKVDSDGRKLDIHALRTTAASRMQRNGVSLMQASRILGHSDPKLTAQWYTDLSVEDLRRAVDCLPPLGGGTNGASEVEAQGG